MKYNSYMLQDVCDFIDYRGKTPKKTKRGVPLVTAKIIKNGVIMTPQEFIAEDNYDEWMRRGLPQKGDIVFTTEAPLGEVAEIKTDEKLAFAQRVIIMEPKKEYLNNHYLLYALQDKKLKNRIAARASGTTVVGIRSAELKKIIIDLPIIETQEKISDILYLLDEKIALNVAINDNLLQQAEVVFSKYYNASTDRQPFTSLISVLGGGTPKTGTPGFWDGFIPFFTPKDVGSPYTFQTEKYITELGLEHCNSRLYPKNTSFVTARGTVGKVSLAGKPMAMNQSCYALASSKIDPVLVYFYVLKAVASLKHKASGAVFDAIVTRDFDTEIINVLTEEDSQTVLLTISPMMAAIHNNIEENIRLSALRDTLLPKLMSGELDISEQDL